ncbi:chaperonin 10-like protein [Cerioporus squamosus]|nr:chaperonin 10-like protein [Cerioporus squamosus]
MAASDEKAALDISGFQKAVRWYPPKYDIRVEAVPIPQIIDPDDAIVKVKLAGLCGSDLHIYRGHEDVDADLTCGHELIGEVVALGPSFRSDATGRPELYSTLRVGDKVVSPFTVSCGECHFCRIGFTCRCIHSCLFGIPHLPGGQAQYVRIPKAGGTLFNLSSLQSAPAPRTFPRSRTARCFYSRTSSPLACSLLCRRCSIQRSHRSSPASLIPMAASFLVGP